MRQNKGDKNLMAHIPINESSVIDILTFEEAMNKRKESISYDPDKWIYYPDFYSEYRYILGTVGKKTLITIGINPSTAEPNKLDPTLKSVERIALGNGYDSFIMFNVYAQRATSPQNMDCQFNDRLHKENMKALKWLFTNIKGKPHVWCAWGTNIERREYLKNCLKDIVSIGNTNDVIWLKTGKSSMAGHPHHPLYLAKDSVLEKFDINSYVKQLNEAYQM